MGGEKGRVLLTAAFWSGSPPHGRGKEDRNNGTAWLYRITPAWAGKSPFPFGLPRMLQDHPRIGGEKAVAII